MHDANEIRHRALRAAAGAAGTRTLTRWQALAGSTWFRYGVYLTAIATLTGCSDCGPPTWGPPAPPEAA